MITLDRAGYLLDVDAQGYRLLAGYAERDRLCPLGGAWDPYNGWWVLPANVSYEQLSVIPSIVISDGAAERLKALSGVTVKHGDGLDSYQQDGVRFLATAGRAILADFPGAGKSAQSIRAVSEIGAKNPLVVTKKSLIYNWQHQISLWRAEDILFTVTNYEQVVRRLNEYINAKHDVLIVDEGHYIKNRRAARSKTIFKLAQTIPYTWILTGSLVMNRPDELWMLLHTLDRKRFRSYWKFVEEYCELEYNPWSGSKKPVGIKPGASALLAEVLAPIILRRTRDAVDLPPLTRETIHVVLAGVQKDIYDKMLHEFYVLTDEAGFLHAPTVLAQLTRLRQIVCTPALLGGPDKSAKTDAILDLVDQYASDHKILVFSAFATYIKNLTSKLQEYGAVSITGDASAANRDQSVRAFSEDPQCRVLSGTYGAMGEGLNLQAADIVILADKDWVPANIEQAELRAHRRGQDKPVHVISVAADHTVDEYIERVLASKKEIIREIDVITQMLADRKRGSANPSTMRTGVFC